MEGYIECTPVMLPTKDETSPIRIGMHFQLAKDSAGKIGN